MSDTARTSPALPGTVTNLYRSHIARLDRRLVDPGLGTGALASLRRGDPSVVALQPTFHRLLLAVDDAEFYGDGTIRWATVVHAMAICARTGAPPTAGRSWQALGTARFPESRVARLLAARGETFRDQVVLLSRFMHSRDEALPWLDLGELVLTEGRRERRAELLRLRIARGYFRALDALATA